MDFETYPFTPEYCVPGFYVLIPLVWAMLYLRCRTQGKLPDWLGWLLPTLVVLATGYFVASAGWAWHEFHSHRPSKEALAAGYLAARVIVWDCLFGAVESYVSRLLCLYLGGKRLLAMNAE